MPDSEAWQAFGNVGYVIMFLGGVIYALKRLGIISQSSPAPAPQERPAKSPLEERVDALEKKIESDMRQEADRLKLHMMENYTRREEHVVNLSKIQGLLENQNVVLVRIETQIGARTLK